MEGSVYGLASPKSRLFLIHQPSDTDEAISGKKTTITDPSAQDLCFGNNNVKISDPGLSGSNDSSNGSIQDAAPGLQPPTPTRVAVPSFVQSTVATSQSTAVRTRSTTFPHCSPRDTRFERTGRGRRLHSAGPNLQSRKARCIERPPQSVRLVSHSPTVQLSSRVALVVGEDNISHHDLEASQERPTIARKASRLAETKKCNSLNSNSIPTDQVSLSRDRDSVQDDLYGIGRSQHRGRSSISLRRRHSDIESWTSSESSPSQAGSLTSTLSSEDAVAYRNSRCFPPQFPAPPGKGSSACQNRSVATGRIAAWISKYENAQSWRKGTEPLSYINPLYDEPGSCYDKSATSELSSYSEIEFLWQQINDKRSKLSDVKCEMAKRRKELKALRRCQEETDNSFMTLIRPMLVDNGSRASTTISALDHKVATMQELRDEYRARESDYETLEHRLDCEEQNLDFLETSFFSMLAADLPQPSHGTSQGRKHREVKPRSPRAVPYDLRGIEAAKPSEDLHPLYLDLVSAVGDLENAKDEYQDLLFVREEYEHDIAIQKSTGKGPTAEAGEFLADFPSEATRMTDEISRLQQRVGHLKGLCKTKRVMRKHMSIQMAYILEGRADFEELELEDRATILSKTRTLAHDVFNEILSQPDHLLLEPLPLTSLQALRAASRLSNDKSEDQERQHLAAKEFSIDSLLTSGTTSAKNDFVNRWLFQQLRQSPLHVRLLHATFTSSCSLKIRDLARWQRDVMYYWWRDSTMESDQHRQERPTSSSFSVSRSLGFPRRSRVVSECRGAKRDRGLAQLGSERPATAE